MKLAKDKLSRNTEIGIISYDIPLLQSPSDALPGPPSLRAPSLTLGHLGYRLRADWDDKKNT